MGRQIVSPGIQRRPPILSSNMNMNMNNIHHNNSNNMINNPNLNNNNIPRDIPTQQQIITQHDELIRYIQEAWNKITTETTPSPVFYKSTHEPRLVGFIPFDLESWWGRRLVQNLNISHGHQ
uniref:Uncharacterized protein n=1 Tax=Corethrella appendiculata TaxID=1370023 RepID=U5ER39_9DIPT